MVCLCFIKYLKDINVKIFWFLLLVKAAHGGAFVRDADYANEAIEERTQLTTVEFGSNKLMGSPKDLNSFSLSNLEELYLGQNGILTTILNPVFLTYKSLQQLTLPTSNPELNSGLVKTLCRSLHSLEIVCFGNCTAEKFECSKERDNVNFSTDIPDYLVKVEEDPNEAASFDGENELVSRMEIAFAQNRDKTALGSLEINPDASYYMIIKKTASYALKFVPEASSDGETDEYDMTYGEKRRPVGVGRPVGGGNGEMTEGEKIALIVIGSLLGVTFIIVIMWKLGCFSRDTEEKE